MVEWEPVHSRDMEKGHRQKRRKKEEEEEEEGEKEEVVLQVRRPLVS